MTAGTFLIALTLVVLVLLLWHLRWVLLVLFGAVVVAVALDVLICSGSEANPTGAAPGPGGRAGDFDLGRGAAGATAGAGTHQPVTATCLLYTSPSPRDLSTSRMPSSA